MMTSSEKMPPSSTRSTRELVRELIARIDKLEASILRIHPEHFGAGDIYHFRKFTLQLLTTCRDLAAAVSRRALDGR